MVMSSRRLVPADRDLAPLVINTKVDYRDKYRGALVGVGIGDALGRPAEGKGPGWLKADYGTITDFIPWNGWRGGPEGTLTDDSELTIALAESLIERREMDPVDFGRRCAAWVHVGRGKGRATAAACLNLIDGVSWEHSGSKSAGNGAAMRAAPIALFHPVDVSRLRKDAAISAVVTHADPTAALSAAAIAYVIAELVHTRPGDLDIDALLERMCASLEDMSDPELPERKPGGGTVRLLDRMREMGDRLDQSPDELFGYTFNGAFVSESLPAALWCFLRSPDDPELVLTTAVNGGYDADTVAAMAGAMAGAYNGVSAWPARWVEELEYRDGLEGCADDLLDLSSLPHHDLVDMPLPEVARVDDFTGPFGFLSNSARVPIEIDGLRYPTDEHAYSSRRIAWEAVASDVRFIPTPAGAIARREVPAHPNWKNDRSNVMEALLAVKFAPGSHAANRLLATGDASLRNENWWFDRFWGTVDDIGENRLGLMLEDLRDSLRKA
jgi:ADP-ribosylglycohydrolase/predicted NAD-dependent protein-ADP-ribosyltransferase YbiA (DUF1768 family)